MTAAERREKLLNAPALLIMGAVILVALYVLYPRQPAFRDPANLSATDALSVAYLRVLVQSDPDNAPLRLSFVQLLTEAGLLQEADTAIIPLRELATHPLVFEFQIADLKLALQLIYRRPSLEQTTELRARAASLIRSLILSAPSKAQVNEVAELAEQFGEPAVLADTYESMANDASVSAEVRERYFFLAGNARLASESPDKALYNFFNAFQLVKDEDPDLALYAQRALAAGLQAGLKTEYLAPTKAMLERVQTPEVLSLAVDVAQFLGDEPTALEWLLQLNDSVQLVPEQLERLVRLQVSVGQLSDAMRVLPNLEMNLIAGSDRQRLIAQVYDWNGESRKALPHWLSLARQERTDTEAENRAFTIAQQLSEHEAMVSLSQATMQRRVLSTEEVEGFLHAALIVWLPERIETELRRHAELFNNPESTLGALSRVLTFKGEPRARVVVYQAQAAPLNGARALMLAQTFDEAGEVERALEWLLPYFSAPPKGHEIKYWRLLSDISYELGRDTYLNKALAELLVLTPDDERVVDRLQQLAIRQKDNKELERLALFGWSKWQRVNDLQWLMRFAWQRKQWDELDKWLSLGSERIENMQAAPDYWVFSAVRNMMRGELSLAQSGLKKALTIRGQDPQITEALIWIELARASPDFAVLENLTAPYRQQSVVEARLAEALAVAEHALGRPNQSAQWFLMALKDRKNEFLLEYQVADNLEWLGCSASANRTRQLSLHGLASRSFLFGPLRDNERLSRFFFGSQHKKMSAIDEDISDSIEDALDMWGIKHPMDALQFYAIRNQLNRLTVSQWQQWSIAWRNKDAVSINSALAQLDQLLLVSPVGPSVGKTLPLSLEDVDYERRWFAELPQPKPSEIPMELSVCQMTVKYFEETYPEVLQKMRSVSSP